MPLHYRSTNHNFNQKYETLCFNYLIVQAPFFVWAEVHVSRLIILSMEILFNSLVVHDLNLKSTQVFDNLVLFYTITSMDYGRDTV